MSEFYKELKELRKERGIDLEEIHSRTKISVGTLKAIEDGQFSQLPHTYTRLFVRAYALEIGADADDTLRQLERLLGNESAPLNEKNDLEEETLDKPVANEEEISELTDGFHLIIDALKLNGIKTIYNVPGIPITDLGRYMQANGMRVLSFRHEQAAGYAAAIAGFLTKKPGVCMTVSAPGFLNGLTALAHATTNCFPMILISGSSEREIVDLMQGDYEEKLLNYILGMLLKDCLMYI